MASSEVFGLAAAGVASTRTPSSSDAPRIPLLEHGTSSTKGCSVRGLSLLLPLLVAGVLAALWSASVESPCRGSDGTVVGGFGLTVRAGGQEAGGRLTSGRYAPCGEGGRLTRERIESGSSEPLAVAAGATLRLELRPIPGEAVQVEATAPFPLQMIEPGVWVGATGDRPGLQSVGVEVITPTSRETYAVRLTIAPPAGCPPDYSPATYDPPPVDWLFTSIDAWYQTTPTRVTEAAVSRPVDRTVVEIALAPADITPVGGEVADPSAPLVFGEREHGQLEPGDEVLLLGVSSSELSGNVVALMAIEGVDGDLRFLEPCPLFADHSDTIAAYAAHVDRPARRLVVEIATDPETAEAFSEWIHGG